MSLEPQWLVMICLLQRKTKNEFESTVTNLLGNEAVDRWPKKAIEEQDGTFFESPHFRSIRSHEILRERNGSLWWGV